MKLSPTAFFKAVLCVFQHMNLKHSNSSPKSDDKKNVIPLKAVMGGSFTQCIEDLVKLSVGIRAASVMDASNIDFINKQS